MKNVQVSKAEMLRRTARFTELRSSRQAFIDSKIPGHEREIFNVIGRGVTEDTTLNPAIPDARAFNLTYVRAEPGKRAALHAHTPGEVFVALSGGRGLDRGDDRYQESILHQRATV